MITRFILNIYAGALFSFLFTAFFVSLFSRLKNGRLKASLLLLPFIKVSGDLFFSAHTSWVYWKSQSVLTVPENSRTLQAYLGYNGVPCCGVKFSLYDQFTFSFGDIFHEIWPYISTFLAMILLSISLFKLLKALLTFSSKRGVPVYKKSYIGKTPIYETHLPISSAVIGVFKPKIVFASSFLRSLNEEERTSVLKHEKSHIRFGDNIVQIFIFFFDSFFWFLPFKRVLISKMELCQDIACDSAAKNPLAIAHAMKKALQSIRIPLSCNFASSSTVRVSTVFQNQVTPRWKEGVYILTFVLVLVFILMSQFLPF